MRPIGQVRSMGPYIEPPVIMENMVGASLEDSVSFIKYDNRDRQVAGPWKKF